MKFKKLLSAILAGAMALSMTATALASNQTLSDISEGAELELTSVTKGATISVVVPTSAMIALNPYELNVKLENGKLVDDTAKGAQIISPLYKIENKSSLPIDVTIKATGILNGEGMSFVEAKPATGDTTKSAFVQMQYAVAAPGATTMTSPKKITLKANTAVEGASAITLAKYDAASTSATSNLLFDFAGSLNAKSTTAWSDDDTIGATIVFSFAIKP